VAVCRVGAGIADINHLNNAQIRTEPSHAVIWIHRLNWRGVIA